MSIRQITRPAPADPAAPRAPDNMQEKAPYIRPLRAGDRDEWVRLRRALWPGRAAAQLAAELPCYESGNQPSGLPCAVFVVDRGDGHRLGGFVEVALRAFAEGCETAPVGYVEGWYVEPDLRRAGIGGLLVEAAEHWACSRGCREMGSDCHAYNPIACQAHLSLGYRHTDRTLGFWKPIEDATPDAEAGDLCGDVDAETKDWVGLTTCDLPVAAAVRCVSHPSAGGIDVFLGTTRTERSPTGQVLVALDYEAYAEMACGQLRDLARRVRERWPVVRLVLLHRVGRVPLGEPSVLVAVATPHRGEAFEACRWLIDTLKAEVAVWKKEVWADGSASWVHPAKAEGEQSR